MDALPATAVQHEEAAHERRNWVRLTFDCNDRCVFCLDAHTHDGTNRDRDEIKAQILDGRRRGATRLILSGGEPTIHPNFVDFVRLGRRAGYRKIQTVTNGRMFAYPAFLRAALDAGLSEITFSIHGPNARIHDALVGTKGAFDEEVKGLQGALADGRPVVNIDVCVNRGNVKQLPELMATFTAMGVREFDLLHVIPFGRAYSEGREVLFYDLEAMRPYLLEAFAYARRPGVHVWLNRFPPQHLEGFEDLIQDPHKLIEEVRGRKEEYALLLEHDIPLDCRAPERCKHCYLEPLCDHLDEVRAALAGQRFEVLRIDAGAEHHAPVAYGGDPASRQHAAARLHRVLAERALAAGLSGHVPEDSFEDGFSGHVPEDSLDAWAGTADEAAAGMAEARDARRVELPDPRATDRGPGALAVMDHDTTSTSPSGHVPPAISSPVLDTTSPSGHVPPAISSPAPVTTGPAGHVPPAISSPAPVTTSLSGHVLPATRPGVTANPPPRRFRLPLLGAGASQPPARPRLDARALAAAARPRALWLVAPDLAAAEALAADYPEVPELELELADPAALIARLSHMSSTTGPEGQPSIAGKRLVRVVVADPAAAAALLDLPLDLEVVLLLSRAAEAWLLALEAAPPRLVLRQPARERLTESAELDLDLPAFFAALRPPVPVEAVPACIAGRPPRERPPVFDAAQLGPDGGLEIFRYARRFIDDGFHVKSLRCKTCSHEHVCKGMHINYVRAHGFAAMQPVP
ncbi:radical SAM protein [Nannocystis bainbridge]|uniref:Radical SAM protein n=1 Tax=Nannocystis bainbridge TaxID=2995303 RepID=A0ABT5DZJ3_9BACT|nr:radical SAM protein [Nannocystis bainbridge]MDC0718999.1 radical SAM protein [Nannocystis bainbridge]